MSPEPYGVIWDRHRNPSLWEHREAGQPGGRWSKVLEAPAYVCIQSESVDDFGDEMATLPQDPGRSFEALVNPDVPDYPGAVVQTYCAAQGYPSREAAEDNYQPLRLNAPDAP